MRRRARDPLTAPQHQLDLVATPRRLGHAEQLRPALAIPELHGGRVKSRQVAHHERPFALLRSRVYPSTARKTPDDVRPQVPPVVSQGKGDEPWNADQVFGLYTNGGEWGRRSVRWGARIGRSICTEGLMGVLIAPITGV